MEDGIKSLSEEENIQFYPELSWIKETEHEADQSIVSNKNLLISKVEMEEVLSN